MQEIEGKNTTLHPQDEELKDLKEEMEAGVKRVQELSEQSALNFCMRAFYTVELDGMDKSLKRLLGILQVQGIGDVKEVLVQVIDCKTDVNKISIQLDDCKTEIVEGILAWTGKTTDQLD
ncbi:serine/threonine-protein kinase Cx32 [Pyrus ussuriensis x Pyrus communis]|uniref:Serine/threonine-protein kinase Cx32 n=1 Tax=Pyrus ussuriensis x Pyrus communis TaxID=2448454 RepID=A0A5N5GW31_9ROSA|nr:serine/threonine-protein kinase Cx32 [Pyrus ussuriensis x Pyrus communis]